jgi:hypothetical protein
MNHEDRLVRVTDKESLMKGKRTYKIEPRQIATGIVQALSMWANPKYARYLHDGGDQVLSEVWFRWFAGSWGIARTIQDGQLPAVVEYFNDKYPTMLNADIAGQAIDKAAMELKKRGMSSNPGKKAAPSLPLSMASKVAFLFKPQTYAPLDSYGRKGLNTLRGKKVDGGKGHAKYDTYKTYLADFNYFLHQEKERIDSELQAKWVHALSKHLCVTQENIKSDAFRRKSFDNILMTIGGR